jgi:hypothetical protein
MSAVTNLMDRLHRDHRVEQLKPLSPILRTKIPSDVCDLSIETEQSFSSDIVHGGGRIKQKVSSKGTRTQYLLGQQPGTRAEFGSASENFRMVGFQFGFKMMVLPITLPQTMISTRRFFCRPAAVLLSPTG